MSRDKYGTGSDPYCYPGSDTLINTLDIRDDIWLEEAERDIQLYVPTPLNSPLILTI